jgi:hypothetical protein
MQITEILPAAYEEVLLIALLLLAVYFTWRSGKNKQNGETIQNYKDVSESQERRIRQLEEDYKCVIGYHKEIVLKKAKQEERVKTLTELLTYQDPSFKKTIETMANSVKTNAEYQLALHKEFVAHSEDDDRRFVSLGENDATILKIAQENQQILKSLAKIIIANEKKK